MYKILKDFFNFSGPVNKGKFQASLVYSVFLAFFEALRIPAIAVILGGVLADNITNAAIAFSLVIMLVSIVGQGLIRYRSVMLQTEAGYTACADKRIEIAEHLRYLPMGYFNQNSLGHITSVTTNTMESLSDVATRVVLMVSSGVLTTLLINLMLYFFDWRIGLAASAGLALYFLVNAVLQKRSGRLSAKKVETDANLVEKVLEYLQGIAEVKAYHLLGSMAKKLNFSIDENVKVNIDLELALVPLMTLQNLISKLVGLACAALSLVFYFGGSMSLLNCMLMVICSFMLTNALDGAGNYSALLRVVELSVKKAQEILDLSPMDIDGRDMTPERFDLDAEDITFSYDERKIINGVSLHIPEKTTTAIVGPSGSGKTTLCNLLSRFWDVDSGRVLLDGHDVREYSMDSLMRNFSFVFQNVTLFHDTVANNIRFGHPEAPMDQVIEAAKKARCHDFILSLPQGYDTVIGEDGGSLSGGERQRLSIARAMMKDAPIIILDEATANVDPENEKDLMDAIHALTKDKTIIMIAHRLKTVQNADQILVMDEGRIVQRGTHAELLQQDGIYRQFIQARKTATGWKL